MITTTEEIHRSYRRTTLERDEILFALRGEIGTVRLVPDHLVGANTTRGVARITPDINQVISEYLINYIFSFN